jgi:hypothetical protein
MFKQHLEMIGRNETPSKKAKFWQSYVRSLKGSDDIRAHETPKVRSSWRPFGSELPSSYRSIYDEPATASERITGVGYRYLPVHRETYGYSPRPIYSHHYNRPISSYDKVYDAERAWAEHQERMKEIERRYPSRYGLYLKDKPNTTVVPLEYEPEDKPIQFGSRGSPDRFRASSVPPLSPSTLRALSVPPPPRDARARSVSPLDNLLRLPIYRAGAWPRYSSLDNLLNPRPSLPLSAITRDPFWYDNDYLRPFYPRISSNYLPSYLRESYLSPIKRNYLWNKHPIRPFAHIR